MFADTARLSVIDRAVPRGACDLCAAEPVALECLVRIEHAHGGTVQFAACPRCTQALRRVVAAIGTDARLTAVRTLEAPLPTPLAGPVPYLRARPAPRVEHAEVLAEFHQPVVDTDGTHYVVRVCAGPRRDGTWMGWLEFVAVGERRVWRTGVETTQSSREDLGYWAAGLEPAYLEGAFARATHRAA